MKSLSQISQTPARKRTAVEQVAFMQITKEEVKRLSRQTIIDCLLGKKCILEEVIKAGIVAATDARVSKAEAVAKAS